MTLLLTCWIPWRIQNEAKGCRALITSSYRSSYEQRWIQLEAICWHHCFQEESGTNNWNPIDQEWPAEESWWVDLESIWEDREVNKPVRMCNCGAPEDNHPFRHPFVPQEPKNSATFDPEKVEEFYADRYTNETALCVYKADYDKLLADRNRLKAALDQVDDVLVVNWVGPRVDGDYRKALHDLVAFNIQIATEPAMNGGFELVKKETV